jgi:hypothetical protein
MKTFSKTILIFSVLYFTYSCNTDNNDSNGASVMEESNKDDYYQIRGYGDSIPSDSIREAKRRDSIRILNSPNHNK